MATINGILTIFKESTKYIWSPITESDTPAAVQVDGGRYNVAVEGTFGTGSIELKHSVGGTAYHSIDATNLNFSADGTYNIEVGACYLKPVRTGGSSMSVAVTLTPIP